MVKKIDFVLCVSARPITNHIIYLYFITNKMLHISSWCFIIIFFHFILISVSNSPSFSRYLFKIQSSQTTHKPWKHKPLNKSGKNIVIIYTLFINLFIFILSSFTCTELGQSAKLRLLVSVLNCHFSSFNL